MTHHLLLDRTQRLAFDAGSVDRKEASFQRNHRQATAGSGKRRNTHLTTSLGGHHEIEVVEASAYIVQHARHKILSIRVLHCKSNKKKEVRVDRCALCYTTYPRLPQRIVPRDTGYRFHRANPPAYSKEHVARPFKATTPSILSASQLWVCKTNPTQKKQKKTKKEHMQSSESRGGELTHLDVAPLPDFLFHCLSHRHRRHHHRHRRCHYLLLLRPLRHCCHQYYCCCR